MKDTNIDFERHIKKLQSMEIGEEIIISGHRYKKVDKYTIHLMCTCCKDKCISI